MPPDTDVSRETEELLEAFSALVLKWNRSINLVGRSVTPDELRRRHVADCLQLAALGPAGGHWVDLGSGAGFPGAVVAIARRKTGLRMTCVESDTRKAAFLGTVGRELGLNLDVMNDRIERVAPQSAPVVSARALAPLPVLLGYVSRHLDVSGKALLMKGAKWREEVEAARETWHFLCEAVPSATHPDAVILEIGDIRRA